MGRVPAPWDPGPVRAPWDSEGPPLQAERRNPTPCNGSQPPGTLKPFAGPRSAESSPVAVSRAWSLPQRPTAVVLGLEGLGPGFHPPSDFDHGWQAQRSPPIATQVRRHGARHDGLEDAGGEGFRSGT